MRKKSVNLFNGPRINKSAHTKNWKIMILVSIKVPIKKSENLFYDLRINEPIRIKSGNLFNDPGINKSAYTKKAWNLIL